MTVNNVGIQLCDKKRFAKTDSTLKGSESVTRLTIVKINPVPISSDTQLSVSIFAFKTILLQLTYNFIEISSCLVFGYWIFVLVTDVFRL